MRWRSNGENLLHGPSNARRAAPTASSMSRALPEAMRPSKLLFAGLRVSNVSPEEGDTQFPSISSFLVPPLSIERFAARLSTAAM